MKNCRNSNRKNSNRSFNKGYAKAARKYNSKGLIRTLASWAW